MISDCRLVRNLEAINTYTPLTQLAERTLGKGKVMSPILIGGSIFHKELLLQWRRVNLSGRNRM